MIPTNINIGCGPHRAPPPWWNVDVVATDTVQPDEVVDPDRLPYPDASVDRIYLGHVLEHVPWDQVPTYLAEIGRVLRPGGQLCVVGPDVLRAIDRWKEGAESLQLVFATIEHDQPQDDLGDWPGARHAWNCFEARVARALDAAGFLGVEPVPCDEQSLDGWPVVSFAPWQCAVVAMKGES